MDASVFSADDSKSDARNVASENDPPDFQWDLDTVCIQLPASFPRPRLRGRGQGEGLLGDSQEPEHPATELLGKTESLCVTPLSNLQSNNSDTQTTGLWNRLSTPLWTTAIVLMLLGCWLSFTGLKGSSSGDRGKANRSADVRQASTSQADAIRSAAFTDRDSNWRITTAKIEDIKVGMRVPAHNPQLSAADRKAQEFTVDPATWRTFKLSVEKSDGSGNLDVTLLRPASWLVDESATTELLALLAAEDIAPEHFADISLADRAISLLKSASEYNPIQESIDRLAPIVAQSDPSTIGFAANPAHWVLARVALGTLSSLGEELEYELDYLSQAKEVLAGRAIGSQIYLDMPELGATGLATVKYIGPASDGQQTLNDHKEVDPANWKKITLIADRKDGSQTQVTFLRSDEWIRESIRLANGDLIEQIDATLVGQSIEIVIPELELNGFARITRVEPCPKIKDGPGEVITATFHTNRAHVLDLRFEPSQVFTSSSNSDSKVACGFTLGVTGSHPFWSSNREEFVPARDLRVGERCVTIDGQHFRLTSIFPRAGPQAVYNLEVANQHVYFVSCEGLLVHNAGKYLTQAGRQASAARKAVGRAPNPANLKRASRNLKSKDAFERLGIRTSSKGTSPSIVYTIYDRNGAFVKFGVSDAAGMRLRTSLTEAGLGATFKRSGIMTKRQAHLTEKYMRSLHYNSTRILDLPGMKYPFPVIW